MSLDITGKPADLAGEGLAPSAVAPPRVRDPLLLDLREGLRRYHLWLSLGWNDIRSRYRRTVLGPFWTVLSTATLVGALGVVNAILWHIAIATYLPFFCAGYISWLLFLTIINESGSALIDAEATIKSIRIPYCVFVFRVLLRNVIVFGHNLTIFIVVAAIFAVPPSASILLLPVGVALAMVNYVWISLLLAVIGARFRDVIPLVTNLTTVLFFITPIFWQPTQLDAVPAARFALADANFAYHLIEVIRAPLLGQMPDVLSYLYLAAAALVGFAVTSLFLRRFYNRIAYWV